MQSQIEAQVCNEVSQQVWNKSTFYNMVFNYVIEANCYKLLLKPK